MTAMNVAERRGISGKFLTAVGIIFLVQVGLLFWASGRVLATKPKAVSQLAFTLGDSRAPELIALEDPTLFVLLHVQGFSGDAWMKIRKPTFQPESWSATAQLRWLLNPISPGESLRDHVQSLSNPPLPVAIMPEPRLTFPVVAPTPRLWPRSSLQIDGDVAKLRLLNPPQLPYAVEAVTNSVVEVLVAPEGSIFSAVLTARSGSTNNLDELALRIAKTTRFESFESVGPDRLSSPEPKLVPGTLIFEWQP
ncbi:MAG TPA: hypothetical protein VK327_04410, partial [Candidatus Paceibacterota bacterium]|nr:hypothetical protein [Candidatus Paceibacterota bacterium]